MEQRKNAKILKILIIVVSIMILVLIGTIAYLYLQTDILKSDKNLFFKYVAQVGSAENGFIDNQITQYFSKKVNTPYTNSATFKTDMKVQEADDQVKAVNNFNITFKGKTDNQANKTEQEISLNYSSNVNFPFTYRKTGDSVGIQTQYISKNFVAIDAGDTSTSSNDTINFVKQINEALKKTKEVQKVEITEQEKEQILNRYMEVLIQNIGDEKFSKVTETSSKGYKLTLTVEDLKNIEIKLLETLKDDKLALDKLNEYIKLSENTKTITKSDIESAITEIERNEIEENKQFEITVYNKNGKLNKLEISTEIFNITINKIKGNNQVSTSINLEVKDESNPLKVLVAGAFNGLETMETVQEAYQLTLQLGENNSVTYTINNNVSFAQSVDIEGFDEENSVTLNDFEEEQVNNFLQAVEERITEVNKQQMEEIGLEESQNPLFNLFPLSSLLSSTSNSGFDMMSNFENGKTFNGQLDETEIAAFNSEYEMYLDTNSPGVTTKGLMTIIDSNNEKDGYKIKEINFNGEEYEATRENIAFIKEEISTEKNYKVEFEKDENTGLIYRTVINEK